MWIKKYKPDVYQKTYKVLMAHDYIVYKLTGRMVTDISMASGTLAYDIHEKRWMTDLLDRFDIDINKFPELTVMGKVVGNILPGVAKELGLSTETKVVAGAQDQRCASLGAGIDKGIFTVSLGTASAICAIIDKPIIDENMQVTCCGLDDNHWILETVIATAGVALKWLKNTFFTNLSYQEMDSLALKAEPLSGGVAFYPHLSIGASGKAKGTFTGLSLQTKPEDIIRAVLEGIAFQMKIHISDMERMGVQGNEVRIFGGGANSPVWCQIIADILNKKVVVPRTHETANLGAAIIAKMGLEGSLNFHSGYSLIGDIDKEYQPDADKAELYMKAFAEYDENNSKI
jgi:xylulokinase